MYKTVCVLALLAGLVALTGRSSSAAPAPFTSPLIVAKGKLVNQTGSIDSTIFTPNLTGLYRLSVYATVTTADPNSASNLYYSFAWDDGTGSRSTPPILVGLDNQSGPFVDGNSLLNFGFANLEAGITRTFQANKGTPITQSMFVYGAPDNAAYSLYYTLERLE